MVQEDKELLLKDISGRLPYGLIVQISLFRNDERKRDIDLDPHVTENIWELIDKYHARPYLRSMGSMTEEEMEELLNIDKKRGLFSSRHLTWHIDGEIIDYLNKKMFDWRGLIPMNLALEAPEEMYE